MMIIFIDTNIFLHFKNIEEINWIDECKTESSESCKLVIAPIVISELDKHKVGNDKKCDRARKALHNIEELINLKKVEIKEKVLIEILLDKPNRTVYRDHDLNFEEQDDRLFAAIIDYKDKRCEAEIYLCTDDTGLRIRANQFGIQVMKLDEKYRLTNDRNEVDKKITKLEEEIFLLKSKLPQLSLAFEDDKKIMKIPLKFNEIIKNEFVEWQFSLIKNQLPFLVQVQIDPYKNPYALILGNNMTTLSDEQIEKYNKKLVEFFDKYRKYLISLFEYNEKLKLSQKVKIYIKNNGTVPAEDIDVHLHFPDGFELINISDYPDTPIKPEPPYKPKSRIDFQELGFLDIPRTNFANFVPNTRHFDTANPTIRKSNSYDVDYKHSKLKHDYKFPLNELIVIFQSKDSIKNFTIEYKISAANMPQHANGKLNVVFIKEETHNS